MEFSAGCKVESCGWSESWTTERAAQAAATWHVYEQHKDLWLYIIGEGRPPHDPKPEALGSKFEEWESQR